MKLLDICDFINIRTSEIYNYISTENMLPDKGGICKAESIPSGTVIEYKVGDILISNIRPYFKKIWRADRDGGCSADVLCIRAKENVDSKYFYYLLSQQAFFDYVMSGAKGCKMPRGDKKQIMQWSVNIPSLEVQRKIAGILGALDDKIELNRRINANLEEQAQALFKSWFVDFEPFKDGPFVDSELGKIPATFKIDYIGNVPHKIESGKRPKGGALEYGVPSIGAENIKGLGVYDYTKTKYIPEDFALAMKKGKINGYELLIYKDGGKPGYFIPNFTIFGDGFPYETMYINEHVFCLDFFDKGFNLFSYFYMQTPYIKNRLNTIGGKAAIPGINVKDIESLPIFSNENEKVKEFGILFLPAIKTILHNCVENKKLSTLRDTLLPKLMKGEIRIK